MVTKNFPCVNDGKKDSSKVQCTGSARADELGLLCLDC